MHERAVSVRGSMCKYSDRAAAFCPTAGLLECRSREPSVITVPAPSLSVASERPPGAAGEAERLPYVRQQQDGWSTGIRLLVVAISASGASVQPVLAGHAVVWTGSATGEASQSGIGDRGSGIGDRGSGIGDRGSVSGRRCDKGRLHRCRAQQSACGRGSRVAGRRHRCHQQVQSGHLRLV
jgi:hypothetical protein